jgi:hypothetical protein
MEGPQALQLRPTGLSSFAGFSPALRPDVVRSKLDSGTWALDRLPLETHQIIKAAMRYNTRSSEEDDEAVISRQYPPFYAVIRPLIERAAR